MTPGGRAAPFPPAPALGFLDDRTEGSKRTARGGGADSSGEPALGRIDQYDLVRKLGGGGFGVVYLARDTVSGVRFALKTLHPLLKTNPEEMEALREKFALVARLTHQNVAKALVLHPCRMIDVWDETAKRELRLSSGDFVMVMDFAPGVTLTEWRRQLFPGGRVPLSLALDVARQIAAALDYAHGEKIVHRDVKPGNVMVETVAAGPRPPDHGQGRARSTGAPTLRVRLLDFGLAAEIRSSMSRVSTETGDTSGTRPYMAPEQWLGRNQDGRTDQYALACVLYEMLSGAPPFAGVFETGDPVIMELAVTAREPEEIEGCDPAVNAALLRALAKDPKERFGSCSEFVENCFAQRPQGGGGLQTAVSNQGGGGHQTAVSKQGEAGSPGVLAPPDAPAQEAEVLRRKVLMARTLKSLPAEDRSDAGLSAFAEEADMELETAEEAFRYARFAAAAQCLDRADAALRKLAQAKAERKAREEAERKVREEAERKARQEAERKAREEAERKAREEAERRAREESEREAWEEEMRIAHEEAGRRSRKAAERRAREEAELKAREMVERRAREAAERKACEEAERKAREESVRKAREEAEHRARKERRAREDAERMAREKDEEDVLKVAEAKRKAQKETLVEIVLVGVSLMVIGIGLMSCVDSAVRSSLVALVHRYHEYGNIQLGKWHWDTRDTTGDYKLIVALISICLTIIGLKLSDLVRRFSLVAAVRKNHEHGKVQLWEGGPYWATRNIGADNPEDYGLYFSWGDTVGYRRKGDTWVASDGSSRNFEFSGQNSPIYGKDDATLHREGWITSEGVLASAHDAAHVQWGGSWRMPTDKEFRDLDERCAWTWMTMKGVNGYVVHGRGDYSDACIFLPAAGLGNGTSLDLAGSGGYYWSSVPGGSGSYGAWYLSSFFSDSSSFFSDSHGFSGSHGTYDYGGRRSGRSVRPVQGFAK